MRIEAAVAVIVIMLVGIIGVLFVGMAVLTEVAQVHARQTLHRNRRLAATIQHPWQKAFHVRADPVQQVYLGHPLHIRRAQCVMVW